MELWKKNDQAFKELVKQSPILSEATGLSTNLALIADIGLRAMQYISAKELPPSTWKNNCLEVTKNATKQGGRCELQVVTAINQLISTAAIKN